MIDTTDLVSEEDNFGPGYVELDDLISDKDMSPENSSNSEPSASTDQQKGIREQLDPMDRTSMGKSDPEDIEYDTEKDIFENVIPVDKIKNGAANAMEFLNWGFNNLKEQAEKLQETESYHKMNDVMSTVKTRATSAYEAGKPKIKEFSENIGSKASAAYESSRPALEEFAENAKITFATAREKVIVASEACKPSVQRAAEVANHKIEAAYNETKSMIDKLSRKE